MKNYIALFCTDIKEIHLVELAGNLKLKDIYRLLSYENNSVTVFDRINVLQGIDFLFDDEFILKSTKEESLYLVNGMPVKLNGRVIMATVTDDGNYTGMPLEEVEETLQMIQWNIKKTR